MGSVELMPPERLDLGDSLHVDIAGKPPQTIFCEYQLAIRQTIEESFRDRNVSLFAGHSNSDGPVFSVREPKRRRIYQNKIRARGCECSAHDSALTQLPRAKP